MLKKDLGISHPFVEQMLKHNPEERPSLDEVLNAVESLPEFRRTLNFNRLYTQPNLQTQSKSRGFLCHIKKMNQTN
tara:strand:- start:870 stop:1097 length:228 start_codon:yes stop_codon:yes gene_type:complete